MAYGISSCDEEPIVDVVVYQNAFEQNRERDVPLAIFEIICSRACGADVA